MAIKVSFSIFFMSSVALLLSSCGGSNFSRVDTGNVVQCPPAESYTPIAQELDITDKVQKTSWPTDGTPHPSVTAGTYTYSKVEFYMVDTDTGFQYQVTQSPITQDDGKPENKETGTTAVCVRKAMDMKAVSVQMTFPSEVIVAADGTVQTKSKTLALNLNRKDPLVGTVSEATDANDPPSKVTEDQNYRSQVYKLQADDGSFFYDMRLADESGVIKKWALVRFLRKD